MIGDKRKTKHATPSETVFKKPTRDKSINSLQKKVLIKWKTKSSYDYLKNRKQKMPRRQGN